MGPSEGTESTWFDQGTPNPPSDESSDLKEFLDELIALCKPALPEGHSGCWGESPIELVTDIIDERDMLKGWVIRAHDAIWTKTGNPNQAKLSRLGDEIEAYINGKPVVEAAPNGLQAGG